MFLSVFIFILYNLHLIRSLVIVVYKKEISHRKYHHIQIVNHN